MNYQLYAPADLPLGNNACRNWVGGSVSSTVGLDGFGEKQTLLLPPELKKKSWKKKSISQSVSRSVSRSVSQSVGQSVSQSVSQSVNQSVSRSVSQSVSRSVGQSVSQSVSQEADRLPLYGIIWLTGVQIQSKSHCNSISVCGNGLNFYVSYKMSLHFDLQHNGAATHFSGAVTSISRITALVNESHRKNQQYATV
jgi:hypothetical protein